MVKKQNVLLVLSIICCFIGIVAEVDVIKTVDPEAKESTQVVEKEKVKRSESFFSLKKLKNVVSEKKSKIYILLLAFSAGIVASFTPCIYPMIPITIGILQAQAAPTMFHNFLLSLSYVLGISCVYAVLGYVAATTTVIFGQWLSNPWLIAIIILLFIYLAFSMFGFYEIRMPAFLEQRKQVKVKGSLLYSFLFGTISGTVASPCLTPALAVLFGFVAKVGSPLFGFITLFAFAFGLGILLMIIGTFSTTLTLFPRSGVWMIEVKKFFGFVLLAMCVYFLQPFFAFGTILKMYSIIAFVVSIYYFLTARESKLKIFVGVLFAIIFVILLSWGMKKKPMLQAFNIEDKLLAYVKQVRA
jgi:thioredoxin:protein disulfide reductase